MASFQRHIYIVVAAHLNPAHPFHFPSVLSKGPREGGYQVLHEAQENAREACGFFSLGGVRNMGLVCLSVLICFDVR